MKLYLKEKPSIIRKKFSNKIIAIFPSRPFWLAGNDGLPSAIERLNYIDYFPSQENSERKYYGLSGQEIELADLLYRAGLYTDRNEGKEEKYYEPNAQLNDIENILIISLTEGCNLRCSHCYADAGITNANEMSTSQVLDIIQKVSDMPWNPRNSSIGLIGGEPLLRQDILKIMDRIHELGYTIILSSNGTIINQKLLKAFKNYNIRISISLDGASPEEHELIRGKNTYNKTINTIRVLANEEIHVGVNVFVHNLNFDSLESIFELALKLGVKSINTNSLMYVGRGKNTSLKPIPRKILYRRLFELACQNEEYYQLIKRSNFVNKVVAIKGGLKSKYCGIGSNRALYVRSDGILFPCGDTCISQFKLADITKNNIFDIWQNSPILNQLRNLNIDTMNSQCSKCDVRYYCAGDCRGEHFQRSSDLYSPHFRCEEIRESILEIMWMLSENPSFMKERTSEVLEKAILNSTEVMEPINTITN